MITDATECYCAQLSQLFVGGHQVCAPCRQDREVARLRRTGYEEAPYQHLQAYRDCGMEPAVVRGRRTIYVPAWAVLIVRKLFNTEPCGPVLIRAIEDEAFRASVEALIRCGAEVAQISSFAATQGVACAPPARG